jgi:hypothetical protein
MTTPLHFVFATWISLARTKKLGAITALVRSKFQAQSASPLILSSIPLGDKSHNRYQTFNSLYCVQDTLLPIFAFYQGDCTSVGLHCASTVKVKTVCSVPGLFSSLFWEQGFDKVRESSRTLELSEGFNVHLGNGPLGSSPHLQIFPISVCL